ncbi:tRNA guanosine(15) transglycosylase TgtA [Halocatena marina]|uniref:tRNA-guanine(15) transglycosylase n=1 Tax=Halocatena marina TaxID=2934937 RepID=A0ABD5YS81_9EURY|nr:tRNA guanosine(15) transglycosylase TgtA [Halocatena marina]
MGEIFEVRSFDAAGRIGELTVPRAGLTVETPALLPVVNPHIGTIDPADLASEFGVEMLITNSYILNRSDDLRDRVLSEGVHTLLDFPGVIMTDSGSFQLAEYGDIEVTTEEILQFQRDIGSDIGTPVDIPTPPDVSRAQANEELQTTQERLKTAERVGQKMDSEMLITAPVQGSTQLDLREQAARHAYQTKLDVYPVGGVVPLLNAYRYADMVDVVAAAKRGLGVDAPVHLFGAGHPMMLALAVALGCDVFDSAAYAIYARDDRYLTVRGTEHLDDLAYFPCSCSICTNHTPDEIRRCDDETREELLARHNLHVTFAELRRVKQAIRRGNLLELVDARARGHPKLLDGYRTLFDHSEQLERSDPVSKDAVFHVSSECVRRPEVMRHHSRLERLSVDGDVLLSEGGVNEAFDETWRVVPPFGPFPRSLSETYPLTVEVPERMSRKSYEMAADGIRALVETNPDTSFTLAHREWPKSALTRLPNAVAVTELS